jgi:hypothetical protein
MEGGIGIFLILVILVIVVGGGFALYITGGGILASDRGKDRDEHRPRHTKPAEGDPVQEHTHFVGTPEGDRAMRERD